MSTLVSHMRYSNKILEMENENSESNRNTQNFNAEENKFCYNFINTPWDERSDKSKMSVIALLVAIIAATTALVVNNLVIHYRGFKPMVFNSNIEIDCNVIKLDDYPYAARIHLISSNELVCVGAVVSRYSVLANEICLKSGSIRLRIGSPTDPRCKKGFTVDVVETIPHDGVVTKNLGLFSVLENMGGCVRPIKIGLNLDPKKELYIIGRSFRGGRVLSFQLAKYYTENATAVEMLRILNKNESITVKTFGKCPVRAGDLLVQNGQLFGLASTSVHRREKTKIVYFANLTSVLKELKTIDAEVAISM